ncbi:hypothetical protein D9613_011690 [Agrocybe pediades]|uniref:O-methyltransferase domain-containing protein n=1 Tax=Agrocybe pediades TaxID=84607 RepID=A0A8H4QVU8_9AGAR|nr:hypothetical protein D9613_011690 [Agrocybe pediades]
MTARQQVDTLLDLIKTSAYQALDEYEKYGGAVPSLDSLAAHPLDGFMDFRTMQLKKFVRKLEGACDQLCTTLAPPLHTLSNRAHDTYWAALRTASKLEIADIIASSEKGRLHTAELSHRIQANENKIASIMRLLATRHCFKEVSKNVFANNRLSIRLASKSPISAWIDILTKDPINGGLHLYDSLQDPEYALSTDAEKSPCMYARRSERQTGSVYNMISSDATYNETLGRAMIALSTIQSSLTILQVYPWERYKTVCDVGSGVGFFCWNLLSSFPSITVTLHDLPETTTLAEKIWGTDYPDHVADKRVKFAPGNFLELVPVEGQDLYYIKNVIHNWPDADVISILKSVSKAMSPKSRVVIQDYVMQHLYREPGKEDDQGFQMDAEEPLLPNYGAGQVRLYSQNMTMMLVFNAKERTFDEVNYLCSQAGLLLLKVWDVGEQSALEYVKKDHW